MRLSDVRSLFVAVLFFAPAGVYAQKGSSALIHAAKGSFLHETKVATVEVVKALGQSGSFRVLDVSALSYRPEELDRMMLRDQTAMENLAKNGVLEKQIQAADRVRKNYVPLPSAIRASEPNQLRAAMLTSEQTAARLMKNRGGEESLDIMSPDAAIRTYEKRMSEFAALKKVIDVKMFYYKADAVPASRIAPHEQLYMVSELASLRVRIKFLLLYYFPEDLPLYLANKYIVTRLIELQPTLGGVLEKLPVYVRRDRVFDEREFLFNLSLPALAQEQGTLKGGPGSLPSADFWTIPGGLHIAVVNDSQTILNGFSNLARWGNLGRGAKVTEYTNIYKLYEEVKRGVDYDVIFSDISMPEGSGLLLVSRLRENGHNTPVIGFSGYSQSKAGAKDLYEIGFDGYIHSADGTLRDVPQSLSKYFYYRTVHRWIR